MSEIDKMP